MSPLVWFGASQGAGRPISLNTKVGKGLGRPLSVQYRKFKKNPPKVKNIRRTRNDHKRNYPVERPRTLFYRKAPSYHRIIILCSYKAKRLWNKLPVSVQESDSKMAFKKGTKIWYGTMMKGKRKLLLGNRMKKGKKRKIKGHFKPP